MNGSILIVDDDDNTARLLRDNLRRRSFAVESVSSAAQCLDRLRDAPVDVVVTDVQMDGMTGIELCHELQIRFPDVLPLVLTGQSGLETAIAAIRAGAYDFITKPVKIDALAVAVGRALEHLTLKREVKRLRSAVDKHPIDGIAGASPAIRELVELVHRAADGEATVLVTGESGSGKELVVRALHRLSTHGGEPLVRIDCAATCEVRLARDLAEPAGAYFLDEIGELPLELQARLVRLLEDRALTGRVIATTTRDLETDVEDKRFREDLFYRVNIVSIPVPPLRARSSDILPLAQHLLERVAERTGRAVRGISSAAARLLVDYDWPGNVRELEACLERAVTLARLDELTVDDLPSKVRDHATGSIVIATESPRELITLDEMERRYVRQVLAAVGGNKTHAARILGIDRRSLYRRLENRAPSVSDDDAPV